MNKSRQTLFISLLLTGLLSGALVLTLGGAGTTAPALAARGTWAESPASQLIFFAVLEGLYRDGVSNDDVDRIIPPGQNGKGTFDPEHFVYACPLCHPAFEAFRLYRQREEFYGFKGRVDTLGTGLDVAIARRLRSEDAGERRQAVEELISRWVGQRFDMMRLSAEERASLTAEIEQGRKKGMGGLKQVSQTRTNCPICDGSFGACKVRTH